MATLFISEFEQGVSGIGTTWAQMLPQPAIADQVVTIAGASAQSSAFNAKTKAVMLTTDTACSVQFGADPTATTSTIRLPANGNPVCFAVVPGQKVAVIANP